MLTAFISLLFLAPHAAAQSLGDALVGTYVPVQKRCETATGPVSAVSISKNGSQLHLHGYKDRWGWLDSFDLAKVGRTEVIHQDVGTKRIRRTLNGNTLVQSEQSCFFLACGEWHQTLRITLTSPARTRVWFWDWRCDLIRRQP